MFRVISRLAEVVEGDGKLLQAGRQKTNQEMNMTRIISGATTILIQNAPNSKQCKCGRPKTFRQASSGRSQTTNRKANYPNSNSDSFQCYIKVSAQTDQSKPREPLPETDRRQ